jgi:hypothetical protein
LSHRVTHRDRRREHSRDQHVAHRLRGVAPGDNYARVLREIYPELAIEIIHPADHAGRTHTSVADFDGLVWSGSALNAWRLAAEDRSQVELGRRIGASVLDAGIHRREILNRLTLKVAPAASARARG